MTADSNRELADQLAKVAAAVAAFPATTPEIRSIGVNTDRGQTYDARIWMPYPSYLESRRKQPRELAGLAAAFHESLRIQKSPYSSSRMIAVEFSFKDIRFYAACDISTPDARAIAKALKQKLPTNEDALEMTAADLARALTALESA